jgi:hypothetical protein
LKNGSLQVRSGCLWGRKLTCYAGVIVKTGAGAWKGVKSTPLLGIKGSIVGAAFGFLEGILDLFKDTCKCDEPSQFQCFTPIGINIIFPSNNPCATSARFSTWGTGTQPSASNGQTLNWTVKVFNSDGTFKNTIIQSLPHSGTTLMDAINIPEPDLNMEIIVVRFCGGQEHSTSFWVNLRDLLDNSGSVIVSGPSDALFLETITYTLNGECLINPNNQHQWTIPSQATLVSGGGNTTSARVTWNTRTCSGSGGSSGWGGCFRPTLTAKSTSGCSGTQSWGWLSVAVR